MANQYKSFKLQVHGRVLEHLGIQMYESPVNALAELVANTWDADADKVRISLPAVLLADAEIRVEDDGVGMTADECQKKYLYVGWNRRGKDPDARSERYGRQILGRKGIGKFAGFGIAEVIQVETISAKTGEKTVFFLDLQDIMGREYIGADSKDIPILEYQGPAEGRKQDHGTAIILKRLRLKRKIGSDFSRSMARRFLMLQRQAGFTLLVDGKPLPEALSLEKIQFSFPRDYKEEEKPETLISVDQETGWGEETLPNGRTIKWRFMFQKETIDEEELQGVGVYAKGKMVQTPFLFRLTAGLGGQVGVPYLTGQVEADYLDLMNEDVVTTERQRVNWDNEEAAVLLAWGGSRVKQVLRIWHERRGEQRRRQIEQKIAGFSERLGNLEPLERRTVTAALSKLGSIPTLSDEQFNSMGASILQAWEQGRLHTLIDEISQQENLTAESLLSLLAEADVLVALNIAEAIRTRLDAVRGLRRLVEAGELENKVRDYIAERPWLLDLQWETFKKETAVRNILQMAAKDVGLHADVYKGRVDLALRSGRVMLVVEFMRPGLTLDWGHLSKCKRYVLKIRARARAETQLRIEQVHGLVVADRVDSSSDVTQEIENLSKTQEIRTFSWDSLLEHAEQVWLDLLGLQIQRAPDDKRLQALRPDGGQSDLQAT